MPSTIGKRIPASGFQPTLFSGLQAWYRADLGITLNGSAVSQWNDQSGNGYNLVQATGANQPAFVASTLNVKPYVLYTAGTAQNLQVTTFPTLTQPIEYFTVVRPTTASQNSYILDFGPGNVMLTLQPASSFVLEQYNGSFGTALQSGQSDIIVESQFNNASSTLTINGNQTAISNTGGSVASGGLMLGNFYQTPSNNNSWTGRIYEVIVFNRLLTGRERQMVINYLAGRYGIGALS